ncbi:4Fe-4S binding protein [Roseibium sp. CAU 1637]|uniref:4Fe-4S binding protein n=1 Tax=Roseibium limicola TaxID=2816037 RepID=A0A939ENB4_9HYPH|nr:4Fe-4S dicluster domain-containing protein [Roseibium limicola]MBO0345032.1 4Fe-4S binding protein [Roseibium limicola]
MPAQTNARILLCSCFKTMDLGKTAEAMAEQLAAPLCSQLCRDEVPTFEAALKGDGPLMVACTQEAPLFAEIADDADEGAKVSFVNIREQAGWTHDGGDISPKVQALIAEAQQAARSTPAHLQEIVSDGMCLVYGAGQAALDAAIALEESLSVTLVLTSWDDVLLPSVLPFPIFAGRLRRLNGALGRFDVVMDAYAPMLPSSRSQPEFGLTRDGAKASCSVVVDLSGASAPLTGPERRDGYLRADPRDAAAIAKLVNEASELTGTFEKPVYVSYDADICAHSHAGKTGCSRCLDACPAGAITSTGEEVSIDTGICGGCGNCAATCPTGAISYRYPNRSDHLSRLERLLSAYDDAGGVAPVVLVHGGEHGSQIIGAMARLGQGLPAHVLPFAEHSVSGFGHEAILSAFSAGARGLIFLADPRQQDALATLEQEVALASELLSGLGYDMTNRLPILTSSDPDALEQVVAGQAPAALVQTVKRIAPVGSKRDIVRLAVSNFKQEAPVPSETIALSEGAPYGRISIDAEGCTLCLSCVSACPAGALADNPDRPEVSFIETACVQCGLCQTTCPESVIALEPRYNLQLEAVRPVVLHREEPATCVSCGEPFGTASTINRIKEKLAGKHSMFRSEAQSALIEMCDDCRIKTQAEMGTFQTSAQGTASAGANPFLGDLAAKGAAPRPRIRTTDDYLEADRQGLSMDDFLKES